MSFPSSPGRGSPGLLNPADPGPVPSGVFTATGTGVAATAGSSARSGTAVTTATGLVAVASIQFLQPPGQFTMAVTWIPALTTAITAVQQAACTIGLPGPLPETPPPAGFGARVGAVHPGLSTPGNPGGPATPSIPALGAVVTITALAQAGMTSVLDPPQSVTLPPLQGAVLAPPAAVYLSSN